MLLQRSKEDSQQQHQRGLKMDEKMESAQLVVHDPVAVHVVAKREEEVQHAAAVQQSLG